jgi:hypothetical protein
LLQDNQSSIPRGGSVLDERQIVTQSIKDWTTYQWHGDPQALAQLFEESNPKVLATAVDKWVTVETTWAIAEQERYLYALANFQDQSQQGFCSSGHEVVIRRLIKAAAQRQRDRVMAAAMVFADRNPVVGYFTPRTEHYLKRFVWRYFRSVAKSRPGDFCHSVSSALRKYPPLDERTVHSILVRWCLLKVCFGRHDGLRFTSRGAAFTAHASRANLLANPTKMSYDLLWREEEGIRQLRRIANEARCHFVAAWAKNVLAIDPSRW